MEDDLTLAMEVGRGLEEYGLAVDHVSTGGSAVAAARSTAFDVVVLDVMLPGGMDGFAVCRELRRHQMGAGILMLTARDAIADRIDGLESGADDYLVKPFAFPELLARVRALARRHLPDRGAVLRAGNLTVDTRAHVADVAGTPLRLTNKDFAILELFLHHNGRLLTAAAIHDHTWNYQFTPQSNLVQVYVGRLRRKLEAAGADHGVVTLRRSGYRFERIGGVSANG